MFTDKNARIAERSTIIGMLFSAAMTRLYGAGVAIWIAVEIGSEVRDLLAVAQAALQPLQ